MEILTSPSLLQLAAIASGAWLFAAACFIGFHRSRRAGRASHLTLLQHRPPNLVDIADLRARHDRVYGRRHAA